MNEETKEFYLKDDDLSGKNVYSVFCSFLDYSWGVKLVDHLKAQGKENDEIGAIRSLVEEDKTDYQMVVQELENGMYFRTQVWSNGDGTYVGEAEVLGQAERFLVDRLSKSNEKD